MLARSLLLAGLAATSPGFGQVGALPDLGDASESAVSEPQERAIGKRIMLEVRADRAYIEDAELNEYIASLGNRLLSASRGTTNDNRRDFEFFLLNDDTINAFALLGGFVGFHSGLVLASQNESELAGVMGHEISHVLQRHAARGAMSQRGSSLMQLAAFAAAILAARSNSASAGNATQAAIVSGQALAMQNQLDYSRDFEREADRIGIQLMMRAGFDAQGMVSFFERLLRANRHNQTKLPAYLQTHPLTTERISDMQSRVDQLQGNSLRQVSDSTEYRLAQARLRVMSLGGNEGVAFFRAAISEKTVLRNRADVYGLALSLVKMRDFAGAERELAVVRGRPSPHPWIERLQAEIQMGQNRPDLAEATYRAALTRFPDSKALFYGLAETLFAAQRVDAALAMIEERLKGVRDDPRLYELAAQCYERKNRRLAQHRAVAEAYYRRGNLAGAIDQLELSLKARDGDFYESSSAEARLRELRAEYRNRTLLPGEKRSEGDRDPGREPGQDPSDRPPDDRAGKPRSR